MERILEKSEQNVNVRTMHFAKIIHCIQRNSPLGFKFTYITHVI